MCNSLSIKTKNEIHAEVIPPSRLPNRAVTRKTPAPISQLVTLRANRKMAPRPEKCLKMFLFTWDSNAGLRHLVLLSI